MSKKTTNFNPMEAELEAVLHPIHPSARLVRTVRQRINFRPPVEVARRLADPPSLLLILGGVLSVSLLIVTGVRAIFYLTNRTKI